MGGMLIGLTGTYGSGKSFVAEILAGMGASVLDADMIARLVVQPGSPALNEVCEEFGQDSLLPDGSLDRHRLASIVFHSKERRKALNAIIHPLVIEEMAQEVNRIEDNRYVEGLPGLTVLNIPLLFEVEMTHIVSLVAVVAVREAVRFRRVRQRDGLSERELVKRLGTQWSQSRKVALADVVIDNSGTVEQTRAIAREHYDEWMEMAKAEFESSSL